jgi:hypothetical protein
MIHSLLARVLIPNPMGEGSQGGENPCPPPVLIKESFENKISGEEGGSYGVQGGEIWIIILRRWSFHWIGPVLGGLKRKNALALFSAWRYLLSGLSLGNMERSFMEG